MSLISNYVASYSGVKFVSGKIKPKYGMFGIIANIFLDICLLVAIIAFIFCIFNGCDIETFFVLITCIPALIYVILISPYQQNSNNYYIEFPNQQTLTGFKLFYKKKLVKIEYKIDSSGKFAFKENEHKLYCISYADGSKISTFTKYRIINYFMKWLNDNNLMSQEVTSTYEELIDNRNANRVADSSYIHDVKYCTNCGTKLSISRMNFCPNCGMPLNK